MSEEVKQNLEQQKDTAKNEVEEVKKEEKKTELYNVYGTEFSISNPEYIDFYKTRFKMMAIRYNLVGRVNNNGRYVIANDVKQDLVNMSKEIEDMGEDFYSASNIYMKKEFFFRISITALEDGNAKASLYLIEYIGDMLENDHIKTRIADYVDKYDEEFRVKVRRVFNLVDVAVPVSDFTVPSLAVVMQDNVDMLLTIAPLYDIASQIYLLSMLKLMELAGEVGGGILKTYNELKENSKDLLESDKYKNTHLKMLLDRAIDIHGGLEKIRINKIYIEKNVKDVNAQVKAIEDAQKKMGALEVIQSKKEDDKKDNGKVTPKKASPKKKPEKKLEKKPEKKNQKKEEKKDDKKFDLFADIAYYKPASGGTSNVPSNKENSPRPAAASRVETKPQAEEENKPERNLSKIDALLNEDMEEQETMDDIKKEEEDILDENESKEGASQAKDEQKKEEDILAENFGGESLIVELIDERENLLSE